MALTSCKGQRADDTFGSAAERGSADPADLRVDDSRMQQLL